MIALHFNLKLDEAEQTDIVSYRLMLFTIFNNSVLYSQEPQRFKFQTDEESEEELIGQIEESKKRGLSL